MKVFISSTFIDLKSYRRAAIDVVNRCGCQPLAMESFNARTEEPTSVCEEEIRACDILVGIYAHRHGTVPPGQEKSITQQEYELAMALGKDCLCFVVQKGFAWNPDFIESDKQAQLASFLAQVRDQHTVALPPLRDYASQRATAEELAPVFEYYLKMATEQDQHLYRDELGEAARQWLHAELPNLHHLWDVQLEKNERRWVLSLAEVLSRIYQDGVRTGAVRLQTAAKAAAEIGARLGEANCIHFQALLEVKEENLPIALSKFSRALAIAEAIADRFTQAFILLERADPLLKLQQKPRAQESLSKAIVLFEAISRPDRAQQCRDQLAEISN
ncbi:MAG: DUF4062 domain-containing protein [candidate division KSB1 bacterium]|nr:DUF4062 domain-containing protein [candidate division KSB1 bacterium]MDZ7305176.1 DUF4062 domain-containing protein [candidate division KSB1 bacterium]MDZ7314274.1 DUF4062 domain-containing protein [candidate division KSB1 bacterium]